MQDSFELWHAGILLFLAIMAWYFFSSLKMNDRFRMRQQARHDRKLEQRRNEVASEAGKAIIAQATTRQEQKAK